MHWVILSLFAVAVGAAKLDNTYLPPPPPNAKEAGGHEDDLQVPLEPPYIDPYTDRDGRYPHYRPSYVSGTSRRSYDWWDRQSKTHFRDGNAIEGEDQIRGFQDFGRSKSRFLYGSYSYTGPDNVLVTVTYTADGKKSFGDEDRDRGYGGDWRRGRGYDSDGGYQGGHQLEGGVIPTPPSLPRELHKAFAFHNKQYQANRKGYEYGSQSGQHRWNEQRRNQRPTIDQGYSYPKVSSN